MGLLGDIGNAFDTALHDVESVFNAAVNDLEALGIAVTGSLGWLVRFLIEAGEDPVAVISQVTSRISSLGGDIPSVLEEVAWGVMTYGLIGFAQQKVSKAVTPLPNTVQVSTTQAQTIADLHQTTLSTMKSKLDALRTGSGASTMAWQGEGADEMSISFDNLSAYLNALNEPFQSNGAQDTLNKLCIAAAVATVIVGGIAIILEVIATAVISVTLDAATLGIGTIPILVIDVTVDGALIAGTIDLILQLLGIDLTFWLLGTLAIYTVTTIQHNYAMSKAKGGSGSGSSKPTPKECSTAQKLLKQVDRLAQKTGVKLSPKRLAELRRKIADGTITSDDLPASIREGGDFPQKLRGLTLAEIEALCKGV